MREIKFRAWNVDKAKMIVVDQMTFRTNGDVFNVWDSKISDDVPGLLINPSSGILMQYIGLKDKNGKEIYEKDYVRVNLSDYRLYIVEWNQRTAEFIARHIDGGWSGFYSTSEVIGNIYENPKLLENTT